jgi:acetyl esterase/lipase
MTELIRDIAYALQSATQTLDVYLPDNPNSKHSVIVYLHPGGFTMGNKDMIQPLAATMLTRGYTAVSVNYRLAGEARFPAQIFDAKSAVRWVRANAGRYNFDPDRIAAWGISAGSTLAALLGTTEKVKEFEDYSAGNAGESSRVKAVVSWYGPMDFAALDSQRLKLGQKPVVETEPSGETRMMGGSIAEVPEKYRAASPKTYINSECPPFYIQHGTGDQIVPYLQSVEFARALEITVGKTQVKLKLVENAGHFDRIHSSSENVKAALDFLDEKMN